MSLHTNPKHIHKYHRATAISYPHSMTQRLYSLVLGPLLFLVLSIAIFNFFPVPISRPFTEINFGLLFSAVLATFLRITIAYIFALICAVPLALLINYNAKAERILLPLFDITQSIPVLAFFPVLIFLFIRYNFFDGAAIFIIALSMLWNIVFSAVGGLTVIPKDIEDAAKIFQIRRFAYLKDVLLPAIFPYLVTGSLLAWAQGWNIVIVAEVLHTYIPGGTAAQDVFGIGSMMVNAIASGRNDLFTAAIVAMVSAIGILNFFVWQKLLHYGERFKFD